MAGSPAALIHPSRIPNRWIQLIAGIVAMMAIANLQYAWTLFTKPIQAHLHVSLQAVQVTFFIFVALETWLVPFEGFLVDMIGPRFMLGIGAIMVGLGWIGSGRAETINSLYFWYGVGGVGAGAVYGGTIGNALKWFPDHRGLCVGLTAGAFGVGTATTIAPIATMLKVSGYQHTFIVCRHDAVADAPPAVFLCHLSDDDDVGFRWFGCDRTTEPHGFLVPCGQR